MRHYLFTVDIPVSVNACYRNGGRNDKRGRIKTPEAKAWADLAQYKLPPPASMIKGPVMVEYEFAFEHRYMQDVANYEKMLTDALVKRGVIEDDRKIVSLKMKKTVCKERQFVSGAVVALSGPDGKYTDNYGIIWD